MKKLASVLMCLMLVLGCLPVAEAEAFDPTANVWYASYIFEEIEYETGEVWFDKMDYTLPTSGYTYFVLNPDGTGMHTNINSINRKEYNSPVTWTQPSAMQVQIDFEEGYTWLLEYVDGGLKRTYQRQSSEYEDVAYTCNGTEFFTNDEDGAIRYAMQNYVGGPDDPWDLSATEEMLKRDMILTAYYDESYRHLGFDIVLYQTMGRDSDDNGEKWVGSISWTGDDWDISLDSKDALFQYIGLSSGRYYYQNGYITFDIAATTPDGFSGRIPVYVAKYEGRECYCVRLGDEVNHFDFQAVPAEVIYASYN